MGKARRSKLTSCSTSFGGIVSSVDHNRSSPRHCSSLLPTGKEERREAMVLRVGREVFFALAQVSGRLVRGEAALCVLDKQGLLLHPQAGRRNQGQAGVQSPQLFLAVVEEQHFAGRRLYSAEAERHQEGPPTRRAASDRPALRMRGCFCYMLDCPPPFCAEQVVCLEATQLDGARSLIRSAGNRKNSHFFLYLVVKEELLLDAHWWMPPLLQRLQHKPSAGVSRVAPSLCSISKPSFLFNRITYRTFAMDVDSQAQRINGTATAK